MNSPEEEVEPRASDDFDDVAVSGVQDDRLRLIFTCCHPALPLDAQEIRLTDCARLSD